MKKTLLCFLIISITLILNSCIFGFQTGSIEFKYSNAVATEQILKVNPDDPEYVYFEEFHEKIAANTEKVTERNTISWVGYDQRRTLKVNVTITYTLNGESVTNTFQQEITARAGRDNSFIIHPKYAIQ